MKEPGWMRRERLYRIAAEFIGAGATSLDHSVPSIVSTAETRLDAEMTAADLPAQAGYATAITHFGRQHAT